MIRALHRWPGLLAALLLIALAFSGAVLSVFPAIERASVAAPPSEQTVADLAALLSAVHPGVEQIKRSPSGKITVWWFEDNAPGSAVFDPQIGQDSGSGAPNAVQQWFVDFHRSLFLDDRGRIVMALGSVAMLLLAVSGTMLVVQRVGGWKRWFSKQRGPLAGRYHTELARVAVPFLALTSLTAIWMVASTFDLLPNDEASPAFPAQVSGEAGFSVSEIAILQSTPTSQLRDLTFPLAGDTTDVFTLATAQGQGFIDQGTGDLLGWATPGMWSKIWEWTYLLHTGQGAALWGLVLGLFILLVPVLAATGIYSWIKNLRGRPRLRGMASAGQAQTVILVASEGGSTWGFAMTFAKELQKTGEKVHVAALSGIAPPSYGAARHIVIMAATWGDGTAPTAARGALEKLAGFAPTVPLSILGFGDSSFPAYCAYADEIEKTARENGWSLLIPTGRIDRQSAQDFASWGRDFGHAIGADLTLCHQPVAPRTMSLTLVSKRNYGEADQAPAAILRFAIPKMTIWSKILGRGFGAFQAGDLLGIVPEGSEITRYYSLASCRADGFIEIAVRKQQGGLCSGQLTGLETGQTAQAHLRPNPGFRPDDDTTPLILIGAGTGVGPLAGFIRSQGAQRPIHLWFGARHPDTDLLYAEELKMWTDTGQLTGLHMAFSRQERREYVQDALHQNARTVQDLIKDGAKIMVCGGRDMGAGVREALSDILSTLGMTFADLQSTGRYAEDVY